jgi:surface protein
MGWMFDYSSFNQNISNWNVSSVTDMSGMFYSSQFNQNISNWDVSSVTSMDYMFDSSQFNQDISNWNVSSLSSGQWNGAYQMFDDSNLSTENYDALLIGWAAQSPDLTDGVYLGASGVQYCLGESARNDTLIDVHSWVISDGGKNCTGIDIQTYFTFQINTSKISGETFRFTADNADLTVNWGDENTSSHSGTGNIQHTYDSGGVYNISLNGTANRIAFYSGSGNYEDMLVDILTNMSDGISGINSSYRMFRETSNFGASALTEPAFFDDVSGNVTDMSGMFYSSQFNQDISNWDVSSVIDMDYMFDSSQFNQNISNWNTSKVTSMVETFVNSPFNQNISNWDVSSVTYMSGMFASSQFNQNISNWDTSSVTDMEGMFYESQFNQDISNWDVSSVTSMDYMFASSQFNQNISNWNVSSVTDMSGMFASSPFNQNISNWDVSSVTSMDYMFNSSQFNQDISNWDVSSVTDMMGMFWLNGEE